MSQTVETGKVVSFHYTLTNDEGEVLDSSGEGSPLAYLHGSGNLIPGLEKALEGRSEGESVQVRVPAEQAYGERQGPGPQAVPKDAFPADADIKVGMQFAVEGPGGQPVPVWVSSIEDETVHIDVNHPLAGMDLNFDVNVTEVREATADEVSQGSPQA